MDTRYPLTRRVPALNGEGLVEKETRGHLSGKNSDPPGLAEAGMGVANPHPQTRYDTWTLLLLCKG
jgi:hypothetical protein